MDPDHDPQAPIIPLEDPEKADPTPAGPALPEGAHVRPGSPLRDPVRELQLEFEEQQEENEMMP